MSCKVAIIGGGPGGLMTAYLLQKYCRTPFEATIYEASARLGGKILTSEFKRAAVTYEAGAAEMYDYSRVGEDPLRELVEGLGLRIRPMSGASILLDGRVLHDLGEVGTAYGEATRQALVDFDERAKSWMSPGEYYDADLKQTNADIRMQRTFEDELATIPDEAARCFIRTMVHSDVATEPHLTSASYGLQNYLMNDPEYMQLYTIEGGIEELPRALERGICARVLLQERVLQVVETGSNEMRVFSRSTCATDTVRDRSEDFDFVVAALPNNYLPAIKWGGVALREAMHAHYVHHDYPGHYLRVSILFKEVFWASVLRDSYFMLDAFGGCCLYDESARNGSKSYGVLGWLLAGNAALLASNASDEELIDRMLDSLPSTLQHGRALFLEGRVHRWVGAVNGNPGGKPLLDLERRHVPHPAANVFVVGDYLFDSTLNGVFDSADYVAEWLVEKIDATVRANSASVLVAAAR